MCSRCPWSELTAVLFNKVSCHSLVVLTSWLVLAPFLCLFNMSCNLLCSISELCSGLRKTNRPKSIPIQVKIWTRTRCSGLKKTQYVSSTRGASSNTYKIWGCTCGGVYVPCIYSHARWEYTVGDSGLCCYVFQGLNIVDPTKLSVTTLCFWHWSRFPGSWSQIQSRMAWLWLCYMGRSQFRFRNALHVSAINAKYLLHPVKILFFYFP